MTKIDKLKERLLSCPKDFTWDELKRILNSFGYVERNMGKTSGSRVRFIKKPNSVISLHKPHPKPIMKSYQVKQVIQQLQKEGLL